MNVEGGQYSDELEEVEKEQRWRQANYRLVSRSENRLDLRSKYVRVRPHLCVAFFTASFVTSQCKFTGLLHDTVITK
jgi:hypothetical protein